VFSLGVEHCARPVFGFSLVHHCFFHRLQKYESFYSVETDFYCFLPTEADYLLNTFNSILIQQNIYQNILIDL